MVDSTVRIAKSLGRDWNDSSFDGLKDGMKQQASAVADQAASIWNGESPDGKPLTTFQRVGAAFGLLSSIEQLVTMPLSMIPFPALPALRILDTDIGLPHAHMHPPNLTPPNPVPVPLPSTGPVIPIPILSGASKVLINNMPAARCGDMGLGVWCGGYFPMYEVFLGSSNVWIEGNRAGRVGVDITKHCIFSAPKPNDPPVGPMFGTTINSSPNVNIGGIPMPSLTSMALGAAFKALFKGVGKAIRAIRKRIGKAKTTTRLTTAEAPHVVDPSTKLSSTAEDLLDKIPNHRDAVIVDRVAVKDLADMTRKTGDEFAVVLRDGKVTVIRGKGGSVDMFSDDILLAHTHPHGPEHFPVDVGWQKEGGFSKDSDMARKQAAVKEQGVKPGPRNLSSTPMAKRAIMTISVTWTVIPQREPRRSAPRGTSTAIAISRRMHDLRHRQDNLCGLRATTRSAG
jgi:uncharacterized Zn-binding protein involved in type VI secretion